MNNDLRTFDEIGPQDCDVVGGKGLSLGLLSFTFIKIGTGKIRQISPLIWVLSALFLLRFVFLGAE